MQRAWNLSACLFNTVMGCSSLCENKHRAASPPWPRITSFEALLVPKMNLKERTEEHSWVFVTSIVIAGRCFAQFHSHCYLKSCWNQELPGCPGCELGRTSRLFVMARATWSLENKLTTAWDREGGHRAGNELHSARRLAGLWTTKFSSWKEAGQHFSYLLYRTYCNNPCPSHLCHWHEGKLAILHFNPKYRVSLGSCTVGLLQGCFSAAACSHKTQNGTTHFPTKWAQGLFFHTNEFSQHMNSLIFLIEPT